MTNKDLSDRIKQAIDHSGLTQRQVADRMGMTEVSISRYVRGKRIQKHRHY